MIAKQKGRLKYTLKNFFQSNVEYMAYDLNFYIFVIVVLIETFTYFTQYNKKYV